MPDGLRAVSGSSDRSLKEWELDADPPIGLSNDRFCLQTLFGHLRRVLCVAALGENRVASGSVFNEAALKIWSLAEGVCLQTVRPSTFDVKSIAVLSEGRVAVAGGNTMIDIWDFSGTEGRCVKTMEAPHPESDTFDDSISCVAALPNDRVATCSYEAIQVCDISKGRCVQTTDLGGKCEGDNRANCVAASPDDGRVFVGYDDDNGIDSTLELLDLTTGAFHSLPGINTAVFSLAILSDTRLISGTGSCDLTVWIDRPREIERAIATQLARQRLVVDVAKCVTKFV